MHAQGWPTPFAIQSHYPHATPGSTAYNLATTSTMSQGVGPGGFANPQSNNADSPQYSQQSQSRRSSTTLGPYATPAPSGSMPAGLANRPQGFAGTAMGSGDPFSAVSLPPRPSSRVGNSVLSVEMDGMEVATKKGIDMALNFSNLQIVSTLGTGTFGKVILVALNRHGKPSEYYAMKVLEKHTVVRLKQVEHVNQERSILGRVDHPGLVNLFCTFQDERNLYMLLEFVCGGELFWHLRRNRCFSSAVTRFYATNILLALEYLHDRDIIYRDLKPENLLLDEKGYIKIADFGFAKRVPDRTFTLCGTPEYLAPEIIQASGHGKTADWWAFGVLLFEMLLGHPPFYDESPLQVYERVLKTRPQFPNNFDPVAKDLILRLLEHDRDKRLGAGGAQEVKAHGWFAGVNWEYIEKKRIRAPISPAMTSAADTRNFDAYPMTNLEDLPGLARSNNVFLQDQHDDFGYLFRNF